MSSDVESGSSIRSRVTNSPKQNLRIEGMFGVAKNVSGSFGVFPSNKQGKDVFLPEHRKQGEYALQLAFDFWSRYEVDVRNVDARYEVSGIPIEAKILFDNQEVALNSAISRFTRSKKLETNSIASIGIWRVFRRDCAQDHGIATVDVELSGPTSQTPVQTNPKILFGLPLDLLRGPGLE